MLRKSLFGLVASVSLAPAVIFGENAGTYPVAGINSGMIRGVQRQGVNAFLGIPYAEPPVGELRWRPPVAKLAWNGTRDATRFGDHCLQPGYAADKQESEDCLFLNVYTPAATSQSPRPVMVWIHGGANTGGAGDWYDPAPLIKSGGVVVVTLNYRLNVFGFLAHPALDREGHPAANYGLLDQQLALKWVRDNMGRFGGNPRNVTIFGQSAGGTNVLSQLASPGSRGLFTRAIVQSGAWQLDTPSLEDGETLGIAFAQRLGCKTDVTVCLRTMPALKLLLAAGDVDTPSGAFYQTVVDGNVLPMTKASAFASGQFNRVPVLIGSNSDDGHYEIAPGMTTEGFQSWVITYAPSFKRTPEQIFATYPLREFRSPTEAARAIVGDFDFACSTTRAAKLLSVWTATYRYEFGDAPPGSRGADHGDELKYFFRQPKSAKSSSLTPDQRQLKKVMQMTWTGFATTGSPLSALLPTWPKASDGLVEFITPHSIVLDDAAFSQKHRCQFWE